MSQEERITRKDILQASSTVLAGALIFLTLDSVLGLNVVGIAFMLSIYIIIISIGASISPDASYAKKLPDSKIMLKLCGVTFVLGLTVLFSAISFSIFLG